MQLTHVLCTTLFVLLMSCGSTVSTEEAAIDTHPAQGVNQATASVSAPTKKAPSVSSKAGVPIYDFEGLEPIFRKENDTTYVINFWATWCAPCVKELPYFEELNQQYQEEKLKVILVSLDFKRQIEKQLIPFLQKHKLSSEVVVLVDPDANSWIDKVHPDWSGAIPATYIYRNDESAFYEQSFDDFEQLHAIVKPFF